MKTPKKPIYTAILNIHETGTETGEDMSIDIDNELVFEVENGEQLISIIAPEIYTASGSMDFHFNGSLLVFSVETHSFMEPKFSMENAESGDTIRKFNGFFEFCQELINDMIKNSKQME